ncbi:MAG: hypothetical protein JJT89_16235, partial [Nitriliruptoraceae bacterium]|nr:hypothetical protein [Nitriliruptoraceae bacterium]
MSRVQCVECQIPVVVDPSGLCPEGHIVGAAGARIATSMGTATPHVDEPQPWVGQVVLDEAPAHAVAAPRTARPVPVAGMAHSDLDDAPDEDSLLRELSALADLDLGGGAADTPASTRAPDPGRSAPATPPPPPRPEAPPPPPPAGVGDDLDALALLA